MVCYDYMFMTIIKYYPINSRFFCETKHKSVKHFYSTPICWMSFTQMSRRRMFFHSAFYSVRLREWIGMKKRNIPLRFIKMDIIWKNLHCVGVSEIVSVFFPENFMLNRNFLILYETTFHSELIKVKFLL